MLSLKNLLRLGIAAGLLSACEQRAAPVAPALAPSSPPAPPVYSHRFEACMGGGDADKGVTSAMVACITEELKVEDERLNAVYQRVMAGLDEPRRQGLRQAQRAWIVARDARCDADNRTGGTIDQLNRRFCLLDATIARTRELEAMEVGRQP